MTPKEYLNQYRDKVLEAKVLEESVRELRERATSITANLDSDRVQSSGNKDKIGTLAVKIADLKNEVEDKMCDSLILRNEIEGVIDQVEDSRHKAVLHLRYIELKPWVDIAELMGYEERQVYRFHGEALIKIQGIINKQ